MSEVVKKLGELVREQRGRYMNADPARPAEIGDYGIVRDGVFQRRGSLASWFAAKGVQNAPTIKRLPTNIVESSVLQSSSVKTSTFSLSGQVAVPINGIPVNAKVGIDVSFEGANQYYFHTPGLRFVGIEDLGLLGDLLVTLAKHDASHAQFWEDDHCVVTGAYETQSMVRLFAEQEKQRFGFTAKGAVDVTDLFKVGAEFTSLNSNETTFALAEFYHSPQAQCVPYFELHKVHWNVFGHKWWGATMDRNP